MTRNRKKKLAIRAEADGSSHARAARMHTPPPTEILAQDVQTALIGAFRGAGWPVESENFPEGGTWSGWLGPVSSSLSRPGAYDLMADPDDPYHHDLTVVPEVCFISPRIPINSGEKMVVRLPGTTAGPDLVAKVSKELGRARGSETAKLVNDSACALCGDRYPAAHLLPATDSDRLLLCPWCVFDGDILDVHPLRLAFAIDELTSEDMAAPAGWSAVAALLACAGGGALGDRMNEASSFSVALPHWNDPGRLWVWLPASGLPPALEHLRPGTSLSTLVAAVEQAYPDLRDRFRTELAAALDEDEEDEDAGAGREDYLVEELWPAAIVYAVTAAAQALERPAGTSPWHLLSDGFEEGNLADCFEEIGSTLDGHSLGTTFTLSIGVPVIARALGWDPDS
ncbi:hypothetical protein ACFQ64_19375 [Streptomyces sp. NPDC056460]|uniref:hypothetical protein n=1 Tax=Streptomyces sp. NPDC056460 TaxID=3345825 RepID=UPI0036B42202